MGIVPGDVVGSLGSDETAVLSGLIFHLALSFDVASFSNRRGPSVSLPGGSGRVTLPRSSRVDVDAHLSSVPTFRLQVRILPETAVRNESPQEFSIALQTTSARS